MMCRRESGEHIEPRYPATLDPTDVNRFVVRESLDRLGRSISSDHRTTLRLAMAPDTRAESSDVN
jgi:hypothetical protein